jgi:hypothetical protein
MDDNKKLETEIEKKEDQLIKKKIDIKKIKDIVLEIKNETIIGSETIITNDVIIIRPYLTIEQKAHLIQDYINSLYNESFTTVHNYLKSEYELVLGVIDFCTDIDLDKLEVEDIINSKIKSEIDNCEFYKNLKFEIDEIIKRIDTEKSFGNIVKDITDKVNNILNKFLEVDVSKFNMEEITKMFDKLKEEKSNLDNTIFNKENESVSVPPSAILPEKKTRKKKSDPKIE